MYLYLSGSRYGSRPMGERQERWKVKTREQRRSGARVHGSVRMISFTYSRVRLCGADTCSVSSLLVQLELGIDLAVGRAINNMDTSRGREGRVDKNGLGTSPFAVSQSLVMGRTS